MKTVKFIFAVLLISLSFKFSDILRVQSNYRNLELSNKIFQNNSSDDIEEKFNKSIQCESPDEKSPYLGALFSGIIPGYR